MKKVLFLLLLLGGTSSFVFAPDMMMDFGAGIDGHEDDGTLSTGEEDGPDSEERQEEMYDGDSQSGSQDPNGPRQNVSGVRFGDEPGPVIDPKRGTGGDGTTVGANANNPTSEQMAAADELSASRGLLLDKNSTRLQSIDDENSPFFQSLSPEDQKLMRDNRDLIADHMMDKLIDKKLFGERPLREGETRADLINKYKGRQITAEAQSARADGAGDTPGRTGAKLWDSAKTRMDAVDGFQRAGTGRLEQVHEFDSEDGAGDTLTEQERRDLSDQQLQRYFEEGDQLIERDRMLNDPNNKFFSSLSPEDKALLSKAVRSGQQSDALDGIFRPERKRGWFGRSENEPSRGDFLDRYREENQDEYLGMQDLERNVVNFNTDLDMLQRTPEEISEQLKGLDNAINGDKSFIEEKLEPLLGDSEEAQSKRTAKGRTEEEVQAAIEDTKGRIKLFEQKKERLRQILEMSPKERMEAQTVEINKALDIKEQDFEADAQDLSKLDSQTALQRLDRTQKTLEEYKQIIKEQAGSSAESASKGELSPEAQETLQRVQRFIDAIDEQRDVVFEKYTEELGEQVDTIGEMEVNRAQKAREYGYLEGRLNGAEKKIQERIIRLKSRDQSEAVQRQRETLENLLRTLEEQRQKLMEEQSQENDRQIESYSNEESGNQIEAHQEINKNLDAFAQNLQGKLDALEKQEGIAGLNDQQEAYRARLESLLGKVDEQRGELLASRTDSLDGEVDRYLGFKKGTRTVQEYNNLNTVLKNTVSQVDTSIQKLTGQEEALGKRVEKRGWFGRKKTVIDYSDLSSEDQKVLQKIREQKQQLEALRTRLEKMRQDVNKTQPKNYRFGLGKRRWGSLRDEPAPEKHSLNDWNRLSDSYKRRLSREDLDSYRNGIEKSPNLEEQPKKRSSFFGKKSQDKDGALNSVDQLSQWRYGSDDWRSLSGKQREALSDEDLRRYQGQINTAIEDHAFNRKVLSDSKSNQHYDSARQIRGELKRRGMQFTDPDRAASNTGVLSVDSDAA